MLFVTDYPDNCCLQPMEVYDNDCNALSRMDFTQKEAEQIGCWNGKEILKREYGDEKCYVCPLQRREFHIKGDAAKKFGKLKIL